MKWFGAPSFILLLSACVSAPPPVPGFYHKATRAQLYSVQAWQLEGRLAIIAPNDSWSAHIEWDHRPGSENIKLSGPLGQGAVAIEMVGGIVKIDRGGGRVQSSNQPEQFINQQLGLFVPVQSLRFWAVGLPESGKAFQETVDGFVQAGWLVEYKEMQRVGVETMPYKMTVTKERVKLKLIIDQWGLHDG